MSDEKKARHIRTLISSLGRRPEAAAETGKPVKSFYPFFWLCAVLCGAIAAWMGIGTLDIVSVTTGDVIPSTQVKSIQHLEGGIVREISVEEGEIVKKGQKLVVLEETISGADVAELRVRMNALGVDISRLEAESSGAERPVFDEELMARAPEYVAQAIVRFNIRREARRSEVVGQEQLIKQRRNEIQEITARLSYRRRASKLQDEQIAISEQLLEDELTNRFTHLDLLKKANDIRGGIGEDKASLERSKAVLAEAQARLSNIRDSYLNEVRKELDEAQREYNELAVRSTKFEDSLRRTVLRSPVNGVIKSLYVATVGGVIRPGDIVVDIVPEGDRLVIEAKLPTQDIGYIQSGQVAIVKLASADAARFGSIKGIVAHISPDTLLSPDGVPYYKVLVETEQSYFERGNLRYQLYPGMQVMANIMTGRRTIFEYLFDPFLSGMSGAMQER